MTVEQSYPAAIDAVPLRHPWRWVSAAAIIGLVGLFLYGAATNSAYGWATYRKYLFDHRVSEAAWNTLTTGSTFDFDIQARSLYGDNAARKLYFKIG